MNLGKTSSLSRLRKTFYVKVSESSLSVPTILMAVSNTCSIAVEADNLVLLDSEFLPVSDHRGQLKLLLMQNGYLNFKRVTFFEY